MEYLNSNTKKAKDFIKRYERATTGDIYTAYKKPSIYKQFAYSNVTAHDVKRETDSKRNAFECLVYFRNYKIIGANCSYFTVARQMFVIDKETGEHLNTWLYVDTPTRQYRINLGKVYIK